MSRTGTGFLIVFGLWLAGGLQQVVAARLSIAGAHPDFLLVLLAAGSLFMNRSRAAVLGFFCGLIQGSLAGANLTHYVLSRTIGGFMASWFQNARLEPNLAVAFGTGFFTTLAAQILLMFLAPPRDLVPYLGATIGSAVYNGILVLPVYLFLKSAIGRPRH